MLADDFETTEDLMSYTKKCIIEIGICAVSYTHLTLPTTERV